MSDKRDRSSTPGTHVRHVLLRPVEMGSNFSMVPWKRIMKPGKMLDSIVRYDVLIDYEPEEIRVWGARFLRDFGPWKKDQRIEFLFVDYETGRFVEEDKKRNEIRSCAIKLEVADGNVCS